MAKRKSSSVDIPNRSDAPPLADLGGKKAKFSSTPMPTTNAKKVSPESPGISHGTSDPVYDPAVDHDSGISLDDLGCGSPKVLWRGTRQNNSGNGNHDSESNELAGPRTQVASFEEQRAEINELRMQVSSLEEQRLEMLERERIRVVLDRCARDPSIFSELPIYAPGGYWEMEFAKIDVDKIHPEILQKFWMIACSIMHFEESFIPSQIPKKVADFAKECVEVFLTTVHSMAIMIADNDSRSLVNRANVARVLEREDFERCLGPILDGILPKLDSDEEFQNQDIDDIDYPDDEEVKDLNNEEGKELGLAVAEESDESEEEEDVANEEDSDDADEEEDDNLVLQREERIKQSAENFLHASDINFDISTDFEDLCNFARVTGAISLRHPPTPIFDKVMGLSIPTLNVLSPGYVSRFLRSEKKKKKVLYTSEPGLSDFVAGCCDKYVVMKLVSLLREAKDKKLMRHVCGATI